MSDIAYKVLFDCDGNCLGIERSDGTPLEPEASYPDDQFPKELLNNVNVDWITVLQLMKTTHRSAVPSGCCIWKYVHGQWNYYPC